jgi:hypothetical protein
MARTALIGEQRRDDRRQPLDEVVEHRRLGKTALPAAIAFAGSAGSGEGA